MSGQEARANQSKANQKKEAAGKESKRSSQARSLRETVEFYMIDFKTPLGKAIDIFIILLNLLVVLLFVIKTYPLSAGTQEILWRVEVAAVGLFIIEYLLRLYGAPDRWAYVKDGYSIIDIVAIMPTLILMVLPATLFTHDIGFIQTIRVMAAFRIFRFLRFMAKDHLLFGMISPGMINVARLVLSIIIIISVYSGLFYFVEEPVNSDVKNFGDAFYFTVVAISTVGFGDIVPSTSAGRLVTVAMIISGIIFIPFQAARIFRAWLRASSQNRTVICTNCGLDRHDVDAEYCKKCGEPLPDTGEG